MRKWINDKLLLVASELFTTLHKDVHISVQWGIVAPLKSFVLKGSNTSA